MEDQLAINEIQDTVSELQVRAMDERIADGRTNERTNERTREHIRGGHIREHMF